MTDNNSKGLYRAFGLTIEAALPLPELEAGEGEPEVSIGIGSTPASIEDAAVKMVRFDAAPGAFLLKVDGVARYFVQGGSSIIIEPAPGATEKDIRLFLYGSVFAALLHQRETLAFHASAVAGNGKGVIISGNSGAGKSTLAAALHQRGFQMLADDVCAIHFSQAGQPLVVPGLPRLKLWEDAALQLGHDISALPRVRDELHKYSVKIEKNYSAKPLPLARFYILLPRNHEELSATLLTGAEKITALLNSTFRFRFLEGQGGKKENFRQCAALAGSTAIYRVKYPPVKKSIHQLADFLEKELTDL